MEVFRKTFSREHALKFIILLGIISLFSDMAHEGAHSAIGPLFALLGASGAVVGFVVGLGELLGNVLRIVSGYFIDRTEKYWLIFFSGYACLLAIPFLALAQTWKIAAALIIVERIGKAIRTPARDAMLSYAAQKVGRGVGFGLHQVFDQIGGMIGPLLMTIVLLSKAQYSTGFLLLIFPIVIALMLVAFGKRLYPDPQHLEVEVEALDIAPQKIPRVFWIYFIAAMLMAAGFADYPLIAFHFQKVRTMQEIWIPGLYVIAMGMSAISAMFFGWCYDRVGSRSLGFAIALSAFFSPFVFLNGFKMSLIGMMLWGIGMGAQRSLLKAIVGDITSKKTRGMTYGIFNAGYGVAWFLGSWLMGVLYDTSIHALIIFSVSMELAAIPFIVQVSRMGKR